MHCGDYCWFINCSWNKFESYNIYGLSLHEVYLKTCFKFMQVLKKGIYYLSASILLTYFTVKQSLTLVTLTYGK